MHNVISILKLLKVQQHSLQTSIMVITLCHSVSEKYGVKFEISVRTIKSQISTTQVVMSPLQHSIYSNFPPLACTQAVICMCHSLNAPSVSVHQCTLFDLDRVFHQADVKAV